MKKIEMKNEEIQFLKRNWKSLREGATEMLDETLNFVMTSVEKDLDMIIERANKAVIGVNGWMKTTREKMNETYQKKEQELEKELEMARMDGEGGAGFNHTLPHEAPAETSHATEYRH
jgi:hypothetical protein